MWPQSPFLPKRSCLVPQVSRGPPTVGFGARGRQALWAAWGAVPSNSDTLGPSKAFHTTRKCIFGMTWLLTAPHLLANLTLHFSRPFATTWNSTLLLGRVSTLDQWLTAGHTQQEPSGLRSQEWLGSLAPNMGGEEHAPARGQRSHGFIRARASKRAPLVLLSPRGGHLWVMACRWETLHHSKPSFLPSSGSHLLLNWVCNIWEAK